jgi:DNA mismatch endonuclease Vsr
MTALRTKATPRPSWKDVDEGRRRIMRAIRSRDTRPEMAVRSLIHRMGYRFRLHRRDLPGSPDLVFPSRRKVIFVHGCFWHHHSDPSCRNAALPKTRADWWAAKLGANTARDAKQCSELAARGWGVMVVWECQVARPGGVARRVARFLGTPGRRKIDA